MDQNLSTSAIGYSPSVTAERAGMPGLIYSSFKTRHKKKTRSSYCYLISFLCECFRCLVHEVAPFHFSNQFKKLSIFQRFQVLNANADQIISDFLQENVSVVWRSCCGL